MAAIIRQRFTCRLIKSEFTAAETNNNPYGSLLELNDINFNFYLKVVVSGRVFRTHDCLLSMSRQQFYRFQEARETMEEKLRGLIANSSCRRRLVEFACVKALQRLELSSIPAAENDQVLNLHFDLFLSMNRHVLLEDQSSQMVPTADSSIGGLKRAAAADYIGRNVSCSICFEEFSGEEGGGDDSCCEEQGLLIMPCSHVFHGDCIKKWLSVSHYCPLCRLEMPTS